MPRLPFDKVGFLQVKEVLKMIPDVLAVQILEAL